MAEDPKQPAAKDTDTGGDDKGTDKVEAKAETKTEEPKVEPKQYEDTWNDPAFRNHPRTKELLEASKKLKDLEAKQSQEAEKALEEQKKYKELADKRKQENETLQKEVQKSRIDQALSTKLVGENVVDLEAALALADRSKIEVGEDGTVSGIEDTIANLKEGKAYLFNSGGTKVGTPTNAGAGGQPKTGQATFKRSQLTPDFIKANQKEVYEAMDKGLIEDDGPPPQR